MAPSNRAHLDQYRTIRLPTHWFPHHWTGPTLGIDVIAYLATSDTHSDQLAWHLDTLHHHDPATRDLLVAASAHAHRPPPHARRPVEDDLIVELYLDYGDRHGNLGHRAISRARWRAFQRLHPRRADALAEPIDPATLATHHPTRRIAACDHDMTPSENDIDFAAFLAQFRTHVLATRPRQWPKIEAMLIAEITGERTTNHPPNGKTKRTSRAVAPIAAALLAN